MSSDGKVLEEGREEASHETPQAITITIMDPSALETTTLDPTLVTSMQAQDTDQGMSTLLVMPREGHRTKDILQTVTETHMGTQELPVISSISNTEEESQQSTIQVMPKSQDDGEGEGILASVGEAADEEEGDEGDDMGDPLGQHCLICNLEMATTESEEPIPVFKSQTSTTHRKMAVFLGTLVGQKLTSRKAHSDIICRRCFNLLDKVDALEVEIRDTKEEIITKFQETVTAYGGRARRRKPATAKKTDYVFPKVEPEEDILGLEMDENFEPRMEDLLEEEQDHREDRTIQDEEWEPEFKRPKIKREPVEPDPNGPPKRKRGRPRKDASKPKGSSDEGEVVEVTSPNRQNKGADGKGKSQNLDLSVSSRCKRWEKGECATNAESLMKGHVEQVCAEISINSALSNIPVRGNQSNKSQDGPVNISGYAQPPEALQDSQVVDAKVYFCPICNRPFKSRSNMNKHKKLHSNMRPFVCDKCGNSYRQKHALKDHLRTHEEEGHFSCKYCCLKIRGRQKWMTHENRHKGLSACICEVCGVRYENKYTLEYHMSKHTGQYKYSCTECEKGFNKIEALKDHRNVHSGDRPYNCEVCGKRFANRGTFWQHKVSHKPERDFTCDVCKKSFKVKLQLAKHMKIHGSERKYVCDICGKTFLKQHHLKRHKRLHTGEKPFICERCGQTFPRGDKLKEHQQKDHRICSVKLTPSVPSDPDFLA